MAPEIKLTLQQLAQLALGAPELNNVNIHILHSLINLILKKLDCQNEKVSITGVEGRCLQKILDASKGTPLAFNDEKVDQIAGKLERLDAMEERIKALGNRLDCHLDEMKRESNLAATTFDIEGFDKFGMPLEDLCTTCDPDNAVACNLLNNTDFLKKLLRRVSTPMVERVFDLERRIAALHEQMMKFIERATEEYKKISLIAGCIDDIEGLKRQIEDNHENFLSTMEEVQDIMDAKLDKIHMPPLKKYIKDSMDRLEHQLRKLQAEKDCPKAAGIIMGGIKCVVCGNTETCAEVGVHPAGIMPSLNKKRVRARFDCVSLPEKTTGSPPWVARQVLQLDDAALYKPTEVPKKSSEPSEPKVPQVPEEKKQCRQTESTYKLFEGTDGNFYRKGS